MMKGKALILFILVLCVVEVKAQKGPNVTTMLNDQQFVKHEFDKRHVSYMFQGKKNVVVKYNPVSLFFGGLLLFYQKAISPQIAVSCPYEINCSNFSKKCIQHYGLLKGIALTADRLTRCTQYTLIDLKNVQLNKNKKIIDPIEQYTLKYHEHK
jgi:putative component of membrane protein insertase Oxa1/YidC/SpoIIIJ protein YidD